LITSPSFSFSHLPPRLPYFQPSNILVEKQQHVQQEKLALLLQAHADSEIRLSHAFWRPLFNAGLKTKKAFRLAQKACMLSGDCIRMC
jgi:hypothetical protein